MSIDIAYVPSSYLWNKFMLVFSFLCTQDLTKLIHACFFLYYRMSLAIDSIADAIVFVRLVSTVSFVIL